MKRFAKPDGKKIFCLCLRGGQHQPSSFAENQEALPQDGNQFDFLKTELQQLKHFKAILLGLRNHSDVLDNVTVYDNTSIDIESIVREWNENASFRGDVDDMLDVDMSEWRNTLGSMSFVADWQEKNYTECIPPDQAQFWAAVLDDDARKVESLGRLSSVHVNMCDPKHWARATALHRAAMAGFADVVRVLLNLGSNVHLVDRYGETALHYASREHDTHVVDILLRSQAHSNAANHFGQTPIHVAVDWDPAPLIPCKDSSEESPWERRDRLARTVALLLDGGADPGAVDKVGLSCLHYAARREHAAAAALLMARGAGLNHANPAGLTPLDVALATPSPLVAAILRRAGATASPNASSAALNATFPSEVEACLAEYWARAGPPAGTEAEAEAPQRKEPPPGAPFPSGHDGLGQAGTASPGVGIGAGGWCDSASEAMRDESESESAGPSGDSDWSPSSGPWSGSGSLRAGSRTGSSGGGLDYGVAEQLAELSSELSSELLSSSSASRAPPPPP